MDERFLCRDVRGCTYSHLEADEIVRLLALAAGNRHMTRGLSTFFWARAERLRTQGLPCAADWCLRLSVGLANVSEAEWVEQPTAEKSG